ncbi:hypothetical protein WJX74_004081 [Apatococcus lobatus]|uniref:Uncharacterized protein n=1 Tax=Apatococcus lobatus TaxID=904363 RepID=A0AAW1RVH3_9CHLO
MDSYLKHHRGLAPPASYGACQVDLRLHEGPRSARVSGQQSSREDSCRSLQLAPDLLTPDTSQTSALSQTLCSCHAQSCRALRKQTGAQSPPGQASWMTIGISELEAGRRSEGSWSNTSTGDVLYDEFREHL